MDVALSSIGFIAVVGWDVYMVRCHWNTMATP